MEKKGGFFQALSEPFCPPAMQFHNPKGAEKTRQQTQAHTRARRQELVNKAMPKSVSKPKNDGRYQLEHLHNNDQNYVEVQQRPILKVKSAAEQYKEDNKSPDVLLSQDAMKAILIELQQLRQLKEDFEKFKEENSKPRESNSKSNIDRSRSKDKNSKDVSFGSNKEIQRKSEIEMSLESSKEDKKLKSSKETIESNKSNQLPKSNYQRKELIKDSSKDKLKEDKVKSSQASLPKSLSKGSLDKVEGTTKLKESDKAKSDNSSIKVGTAKKLQPSNNFTTPKQVYQQLDQMAREKKDSLRDSKGKTPINKDLDLHVSSEEEESSIYTEFNDED